MEKSYIKFSSITHAMRGRDVLHSKGMASDIGKNTDINKNGCAYRLYPRGDIHKAYEIILRAGVKNTGVFWGEGS